MKLPSTNTILIVAVLAGGYLLGNLIPASKPKTYLKEFIASKDSTIAQSHRREIALIEGSAEDKAAARGFKDRDTVYITKLISNDKKLKDVINSVRDASKDELRSYRPEN